MRVTNWGLFLLGVYLILYALTSSGFFLLGMDRILDLLALVAGVLIIMDTWRR